jgi:hypothetical protein
VIRKEVIRKEMIRKVLSCRGREAVLRPFDPAFSRPGLGRDTDQCTLIPGGVKNWTKILFRNPKVVHLKLSVMV